MAYRRDVRMHYSNVLGIVNKMAVCQILFLVFDIGCNLVLDSTSSDPMIGFIIFIIQVLAILANLISFLMISSHDTIQNKFYAAKTQVHNLSALTTLAYLILTIAWHIWSLRRSWPAASDQFSYSFLPKRKMSTNASEDRLPFGSGFDNLKDNREFYTLWSPGFIALYTSQRTVSLIYYGVHLLSMSVLDSLHVSLADTSPVEGQRAVDLRMRSISAFIDTRKESSMESHEASSNPQAGRTLLDSPQRQRPRRQGRLQSTSEHSVYDRADDGGEGSHDVDSTNKPVSWESEQTLPIGSHLSLAKSSYQT